LSLVFLLLAVVVVGIIQGDIQSTFVQRGKQQEAVVSTI